MAVIVRTPVAQQAQAGRSWRQRFVALVAQLGALQLSYLEVVEGAPSSGEDQAPAR